MSNLETAPGEVALGAGTGGPVREVLAGREVVLGLRADTVIRTLPHRDRRMVGAWCFADLFGPEDVSANTGMQVPPHPHTGLQTVSWLVRGEILHRDSLGSTQLVEPGQLNLMTAGRGIAHSEESPAGHSAVLHGAQLWVALPAGVRAAAPDFAHHADLPTVALGGLAVVVLLGEFAGAVSPAAAYTPIVGAEGSCAGAVDVALPVREDFEYAVLPLDGAVEVDGEMVEPGPLVYLGTGRREIAVRTGGAARFLLLGGEPFEERIVMWWNFVGRSHEDIAAYRARWEHGHDGFGEVPGYAGDPLPAPPLPTTRLKPRGRVR